MKISFISNSIIKISSLCMMYIAQGITHGFLTTTLINYFVVRGLKSVDIAETLAIASIPWAFKWIWGPIIDRFSKSAMGRRRPFIISAQALMTVSILLLLMIGDLTENLNIVAWIILAHNIFKSIQDVAVDALAIDILEEHERGRANGLMFGCSYLGALIGINLTYVVTRIGIEYAIIIMAIFLFIIMLIPLFLCERPGEKVFPWSKGQATKHNDSLENDSIITIFKYLIKAFSLRSTLLCAFVAITLYISLSIMAPLGSILMIKKLGYDEEFLSQIATIGSLTAMLGSMSGGFIADRIGHRRFLKITLLLFSLLWFFTAFTIPLWRLAEFHLINSVIGGLLMGFMASSFYSIAMDVSWKKVGGSQFSSYMALLNLSIVISYSLSVPLEKLSFYITKNTLSSLFSRLPNFSEFELIPYALIFIFMSLFHIVVIIPLMFIDTEQTKRVLD